MSEAIGCQDNSCIFKILRGAGVGTNAGCRCFEALISWNEEAKQWNRPEVRKVQHDTQRLAHALRTAQKRIEELEAALRRTLSRCTNCDTCGPALCSECEIDVGVLAKVKP